MASVQKRTRNGKTRWVARWRQPDGTERSKSFDRKGEASSYAHRKEAEANRHAHLDRDRDRVTVGQWLDVWLDDIIAPRCAAGRLAPKTAQGYEQRVRTHIRPAIGHVKLAHLTAGHVDTLLTGVVASGLSPGTARRVRAVLSKALSDAQARDLVDRNAARDATPPETPKTEPSSFSPDEYRAIVAELEGTYGRAVRFAVHTGLRTSEVLGLRWDDVDLDGRTYQVRQAVHRISGAAGRVVPQTGVVTGPGKTDASRLPTKMSQAAADVLAAQRKAQAAERLASPVWHDPQIVFASQVGTWLEPRNIRRALDRAMDAAGVSKVGSSGRGRGMHELRRTFATVLLADGVPLHVVQRLGRWSSPQVLLNSYAQVLDEQQADAADRLAASLDDGGPSAVEDVP